MIDRNNIERLDNIAHHGNGISLEEEEEREKNTAERMRIAGIILVEHSGAAY